MRGEGREGERREEGGGRREEGGARSEEGRGTRGEREGRGGDSDTLSVFTYIYKYTSTSDPLLLLLPSCPLPSFLLSYSLAFPRDDIRRARGGRKRDVRAECLLVTPHGWSFVQEVGVVAHSAA